MVSGLPGFAQTYLSCTTVHGEEGVGVCPRGPPCLFSLLSETPGHLQCQLSPLPPERLQWGWPHLSWQWFQDLVHCAFVAIATVVTLVHGLLMVIAS